MARSKLKLKNGGRHSKTIEKHCYTSTKIQQSDFNVIGCVDNVDTVKTV